MLGLSSLGKLSSNHLEGEEDALPVHLKGPRHISKRNKKRLLFLLVWFIVLIILFLIVWLLENYHPVHSLVPATTVPPEHEYYTLPSHLVGYRNDYKNNRFIQTLYDTHHNTNRTQCWVCGLLPPAHHRGASFVPMPFSRNGSCKAWYEMATMWYFVTTRPDTIYSLIMRGNIIRECKLHNTTVEGTDLEQVEYENVDTSVRTTQFRKRNTTKDEEIPIGVYPVNSSFYIQAKGKIEVGNSLCNEVIAIRPDNTPSFIASKNTCFVCGDTAYIWLPVGWSGTCYISFLLPPTYIAPPDYHRTHRMYKRDVDQTDTAGQQFVDATKGLIPIWGPSINSLEIRRLTRVLEATINVTEGIIANMSVEMQANRLVTLQNRMVLDLLLAEKGGVCHLIGSFCCVYIRDSTPNVQLAIQKLHRIAAEIHIENGTWTWSGWMGSLLVQRGWKLLMILLAIGGVFICCCCGVQCFPLCISSCFFACKPSFDKLQKERALVAQEIQIEEFCKISSDLFSDEDVKMRLDC